MEKLMKRLESLQSTLILNGLQLSGGAEDSTTSMFYKRVALVMASVAMLVMHQDLPQLVKLSKIASKMASSYDPERMTDD